MSIEKYEITSVVFLTTYLLVTKLFLFLAITD
jgi:hypothetical protein